MNLGPIINWRQVRKDALYVAGVIGLSAVLLLSCLLGNSYMGRVDAMLSGPYVVERHDGRRLFVGADSLGWTVSLADAQRFGTFAQAKSVQSRIGGMVMSVREVVK